MKQPSQTGRRLSVSVLVVAGLLGIIGYGVAQQTSVTQAEWAVYLTQGLGLDWHLPPNAKSNDYIARLDWSGSLSFDAGEDAKTRATEASPTETFYEVSMLRPGDYGFRVKIAGGNGVLRVGEETFEIFQPENSFRWVDLSRVSLNAGAHPMSLMLADGARADELSITPPCTLPVEPKGGWDPLQALTYGDMAASLAKALELESDLPELGQPQTARGEDFKIIMRYPWVEEDANVESTDQDPFWLSSEDTILTARVKFEVPEDGLYSFDSRYISSRPVRWNVDGCLRVVTCARRGTSGTRGKGMAMELEAGEHELEVTLPPRAKLDRVDIQRRDASPESYVAVARDEGFKFGRPEELVARRRAVQAARRLRSQFDKLVATRCNDGIGEMVRTAELMALQNSSDGDGGSGDGNRFGNVPDPSLGGGLSTDRPPSDPLVPQDDDEPDVGSPVAPEPTGPTSSGSGS